MTAPDSFYPHRRIHARFALFVFTKQDAVTITKQAVAGTEGLGMIEQFSAKPARNQATFAFFLGTVCAIASLLLAQSAYHEEQGEQLIRQSGAVAMGKIIRKYVDRDGKTRRVEYEFEAQGQTVRRDVEVIDRFYEKVEPNAPVPVIYANTDPTVSHMRAGEVRARDGLRSPTGRYAMAAVGGLFALILIAGAGILWKGSSFRLLPAKTSPPARAAGEMQAPETPA
jgi:hypothetical protein